MAAGQALIRYSERHLGIIEHQFSLPRKSRNYKVMDIMMRHLRFLKRHEPKFRYAIYRAARYEVIPPQTTVFRMGDPADYLYIILKGKVSVQSSMSQYADIPVVLNTLADGEHFGELSIIDEARLGEGKDKEAGPAGGQKGKARARAATCRTVEATKVLKIECLTA